MHTYFVDGLAADAVEPRELQSALQRAGSPTSTLFSTRTYLQLVCPTVPEILGVHVINTTLICLFRRPVEPNHDFDCVRPGSSKARVLNSVDIAHHVIHTHFSPRCSS